VPVVEETLFRGVLYGALRRHWPFAPAALASGAVFAVGHLSLAGAIPYLLLGLLFAYLYERSGSLVAPWAAHGAFNAFNLAVLLALFG
jgi:membrane protease YdiL (CAAX protease family)